MRVAVWYTLKLLINLLKRWRCKEWNMGGNSPSLTQMKLVPFSLHGPWHERVPLKQTSAYDVSTSCAAHHHTAFTAILQLMPHWIKASIHEQLVNPPQIGNASKYAAFFLSGKQPGVPFKSQSESPEDGAWGSHPQWSQSPPACWGSHSWCGSEMHSPSPADGASRPTRSSHAYCWWCSWSPFCRGFQIDERQSPNLRGDQKKKEGRKQ